MQLHLISPEKPLYTGDIDMATIPGGEGKFGMLPGHAPFVSTLKAGIITFNPESPTPTRLAVLDGVVEIALARCTVLAETAESLEA